MDWKATLEEILADRRRQLGERPSEDEVVAFSAGELSDDERERLLEHAAVDPEVARELFDALRFPEVSGDESLEPEADGVDERWQSLRRRLVAEGDLPVKLSAAPVPPRRAAWLPLAAMFVLGVSAALVVARLRAPGPAVDPRINLAIVELLPVDEEADVRGSAEAVAVAADTGGLVLTLAVPALAPSSGRGPYVLELTRGDGTTSTVDGLQPGVGGVFVLDLPRGDWTEGLHELRLKDAASRPVARFQLEVELNR